MLKRIRNLWRISSIELPKPDTKTLQQKLREAILEDTQAIIVDTKKPVDMFPEHETTE